MLDSNGLRVLAALVDQRWRGSDTGGLRSSGVVLLVTTSCDSQLQLQTFGPLAHSGEHPACNREAARAKLAGSTKFGVWCKGRIRALGACGEGSIPSTPTNLARLAQTVERRSCKPMVTGATPVPGSSLQTSLMVTRRSPVYSPAQATKPVTY